MIRILEGYNFVFRELLDARVQNWAFSSQPWGLFGIIMIYLYGIYIGLPAFMADRKPYNLKIAIAAYNVYQVVACSALIYCVATSGWTTHYTFGCQTVDYSENKTATRMVDLMWWHMLLKLSELLETVFFVLRKKSKQVTGLHVYHHISTLVIAWIACNYFAGGMITFTVLINSFVHILMYTYYFLASLGPEMQKRLQVVKSKLTLVQMAQLCIIFFHTVQVVLPDCEVPNAVAYIYLPNVGINIFLFLKFYLKSYSAKKTV